MVNVFSRNNMSLIRKKQFPGHFLVLDVGYPMTKDCLILIKNSLMNIICLASCLKGISRLPVFGLGILDVNFQVIQKWDFVAGNFIKIENNFECIENELRTGVKLSLKDYKSILESSIENLVRDFDLLGNEWRLKTTAKEKFNTQQYWPTQIQVTVITKKAACPIVQLIKENPLCTPDKIRKIEFVEISNCPENKTGILRKHIHLISCCIVSETASDMDGVFKKWITENDSDHEQLRLILNKESDLQLKCDLNDCIINPYNLTVPQNFFLPGNFETLLSHNISHLPDNFSICELEIIQKTEVSSVCPSMLFGLPQRIYATKSCALTWDELQYNEHLFKSLCVQLCRDECGLIARLKTPRQSTRITPIYFIVSDGAKMLIENVIPMELQLPQRLEPLVTLHPVNNIEEEKANTIIGCYLRQLDVAEGFSPHLFSTRVYENLKEHLSNQETKKYLPQRMKLEVDKIPTIHDIKRTEPVPKLKPGKYTPKFLKQTVRNARRMREQENPDKVKNTKPTKKRQEMDMDTIHPALLPREIIAKYRKFDDDSFKLPELTEPGIVEK